ncbi:MAG: four helix bundle protein [Planctomycetes bacterium]|nr:four helix bundle protein [Planctomycetota bacterium]
MMIERFEDLEVWQLSRKLVKDVYELTSGNKFQNDFNLCRHMQKTAVSIMSNIAEGFERQSKKEFIRFLYTAKGSCGELRSQLYVAFDLTYIEENGFNEIFSLTELISKSIAGFIKYLRKF